MKWDFSICVSYNMRGKEDKGMNS